MPRISTYLLIIQTDFTDYGFVTIVSTYRRTYIGTREFNRGIRDRLFAYPVTSARYLCNIVAVPITRISAIIPR